MQVRLLRAELGAAQAATEAAAQLASEWRQRAEQFDKDRQVAAANIRWVRARHRAGTAGPPGRQGARPGQDEAPGARASL